MVSKKKKKDALFLKQERKLPRRGLRTAPGQFSWKKGLQPLVMVTASLLAKAEGL